MTRIIREDLTRFSRRPRRRIDITVHLGDRGIGIENKPWAEEGEDQLKDYRYHLEKRYKGRFILVYLSGQGEDPKSLPRGELRALRKTEQLKILTYGKDVTDWIKASKDVCQSDHVRWFLEDFYRYLNLNFPSARPNNGSIQT